MLDRVERRRAGGRGVKAKAFGVVWTDSEVLLGRLPDAGEYVAVDLTVLGDPAALRLAAGGPGLGPPCMRSAERFTADPLDLGRVFLEDGSEVGVVLTREGTMLSFRWHAGLAFFEDSATAADTAEPEKPAEPAASA